MASTYSTNLKIELIGTGEQAGTWGTTTNTNLGTALEQAIVGYGNPNFTSDANLTITLTDSNATQTARAFSLNVTSGVSLTTTRNLIVPTIQKPYMIFNNTTGSQSIVVKTSAGTGVTVPNGARTLVYVDGTNVVSEVTYLASLTTPSATITGGSITGITDLAVADGGTGASSFTANNVLLGNGTSAFQVVAPSTSGNVLTSNGTSWVSSALTQYVGIPQGRVTLTTGVPVTTTAVTSATTVYYTPYQGDKVPIYNGTSFTATTFAELSQATTDSTKSPAAVAADKVYDLFVWDDSGTLRCTRGPAWTNDTTRGYTLTMTNGILLNTSTITNGPGALRGTYVGTIRSDSSSQINDSTAKRHVWNTYNRVTRAMQCALETANSWTYSTATYRQANANTANQLDYVCGLAEDQVDANVFATWADSGAADTATGIVGVGVDTTTSSSAQQMTTPTNPEANIVSLSTARYGGVPGVGRHYLAWLERGNTSGTTTWYGDKNAPTLFQSGISGTVRA